jgi:hypothetical protein
LSSALWLWIETISKLVIKAVSAGKKLHNFILKVFFIFIRNIFRRSRKVQAGNSPYEIIPNTLNTYANHITTDIRNKDNQHVFVLKLEALKVSWRFVSTSSQLTFNKFYYFVLGQHIPL